MFDIPKEHITNVQKFCDIRDVYASLAEEAGELITAVSKHSGGRFLLWEKSRQHIIEEMTHVLVSMNLVALELDISLDDIHHEIERKALHDRWDSSEYSWDKSSNS